MSHRFVLVGVLVAALGVVGTRAEATVVEHEHYADIETFTTTDCGFTLNGVNTFSGNLRVRADKDGEFFYGRDTIKFEVVFTNPDTGGWFTISGNSTFNEVQATLVSGTVYEVRAVEAGQPFVMRASDGTLIARDRGSIEHHVLFDTLGDGEPGGEILEFLEPTVHGPHPGFAEDFPFCEFAAALTGAEG